MAEQRSRLRRALLGLALALFAAGLSLFWTAPDPERIAPVGEAAARHFGGRPGGSAPSG